MSALFETFKVFGNGGELTVDADTGKVIAYDDTDADEGGEYADIAELDVAEWKRRYPGESIEGAHDVLDFGAWSKHGVYIPPVEEWRKQREAAIAAGAT